MNSQTLTNVGVIVGGILGLLGLLIAWRQSKIVSDQRAAEETAQKVKEATDPLIAQKTRLEAINDRLVSRVDQLEDELRRGRGHGDNDAQRQPPGGG